MVPWLQFDAQSTQRSAEWMQPYARCTDTFRRVKHTQMDVFTYLLTEKSELSEQNQHADGEILKHQPS